MAEDRYVKDEDEGRKGRFGQKVSGLEDLLNRNAKEGSKWSWGLFVLIAGALYAIVNLIIVVLKIFT